MARERFLHCSQYFPIQVSVEGEDSCLRVGDICVVKFQILLNQFEFVSLVCKPCVKTILHVHLYGIHVKTSVPVCINYTMYMYMYGICVCRSK